MKRPAQVRKDILKVSVGIISFLFLIACAQNGRDYDWGVSCSELKRNHKEISRIEERIEGLHNKPSNEANAGEIESLMRRKRDLLSDNDELERDCRPIYR